MRYLLIVHRILQKELLQIACNALRFRISCFRKLLEGVHNLDRYQIDPLHSPLFFESFLISIRDKIQMN